MRHYIKQNEHFVTQSEMWPATETVSEISVKIVGIVDWKKKFLLPIKDRRIKQM